VAVNVEVIMAGIVALVVVIPVLVNASVIV
jgi:hypothetical protein